ncbi:MAG: enoyl-CoA hydratase [Rhodocyclaceae bacterium]|jgi:2-(1,2-epoxy-1,2-dihydrophenyl)acetyl-CoA isomerase|nr:enoyl-CoA hydratase [Rhodocyclaceae bacterium]
MANDTVLLEVRDGIATLTLNRPQAMNSLGQEMSRALLARMQELAAREGVRVVVVTGAGDHFMAGGDIKEFRGMLAAAPAERESAFRGMIGEYINPAVEILRGLPQPVVGKVRGACAGFGFSLMLGCDLVVAADNAYFTTGYSLLGTTADGGGTYFLPRAVGARKAAELMLLADRLDAGEVLGLGLINRVVPLAGLDAECDRLARRLAAGPARAYAGAKRLLNASLTSTLADQLRAEGESFGRCSATGDFAEGVSAFIEKRKPSFKGG